MRRDQNEAGDGAEDTQANDDCDGSDREETYEFSLDPETRAVEKRLRRIVAKQASLFSNGCPSSCVARLL